MGLFDPPSVKIRKKVPRNLWNDYDQLQRDIESEVPHHLNGTQAALVIGYVMAGWALSEHRCGRIKLTDHDGRYISNMGINCHNMLGEHGDIALGLVRVLVENGVIIEPEN